MAPERSSTSESESSVDVVLFAGRRQSRGCDPPRANFKRRSRRMKGQQKPRKCSPKQNAHLSIQDECVMTTSDRSLASSPEPNMPDIAELTGQSSTCGTRGSSFLVRRSSVKERTKDKDMVDDYLMNVQDYGCSGDQFIDPRFVQRELGSLGPSTENDDESADERRHASNRREWRRGMLGGSHEHTPFDQASYVTPGIQAGGRKGSIDGSVLRTASITACDVRWPSSSRHTTTSAAPHVIEAFDQSQTSTFESEGFDDSDSDAALAEKVALDLQEEIQLVKYENDFDKKHLASMSDQQIASILSKQAQLGISGDEILLCSADEPIGDIYARQLEEVDTGSSPRVKRWLEKEKVKKRCAREMPSSRISAESYGQDAYDGFDIMDHERSSILRRHKKGCCDDPVFELPDANLQASIRATWSKDRAKKKQRKKEREELRAQGLLGKKAKQNVSVGYRNGIDIQQVKHDIKAFLSSPIQQLKLPPMAHQERKFIHQAARSLNLKSKSHGNGLSRCPILYKTSRTSKAHPDMLNFVDDMSFHHKSLPRLERHKRGFGVTTKKGRGSGTSLGVSYQDGEIVGIGAPELGQENRGRAMLEKMGWSDGSALGASNNKGITAPVTQVVKVSKAGLG